MVINAYVSQFQEIESTAMKFLSRSFTMAEFHRACQAITLLQVISTPFTYQISLLLKGISFSFTLSLSFFAILAQS